MERRIVKRCNGKAVSPIQNGDSKWSSEFSFSLSRRFPTKTGGLVTSANLKHIHTSLEWPLKQSKDNKNFSPLAFYEQWLVEGHPLHPGAKTKFGLDVEDLIQYSPEWGATPKVALVAVAKDYCQTTSIDTHTVTTCTPWIGMTKE
ncbi:hypothetical protein HFZ78_07335 [Priestia megaterium]|uniref:Aerobactin siderophore biosynthesis IucA/IucC N-terminal domain-containing protein n=1 Tax=Priestia megaterium TaxID=1404 RepID=A0A6H1NZQ5_PRIMG|nr:IucA/IucC family protein [Priestia megaterium]QIZ06541.1 hypothetical protein HFZ78_07335 [Priestia megaterium]